MWLRKTWDRAPSDGAWASLVVQYNIVYIMYVDVPIRQYKSYTDESHALDLQNVGNIDIACGYMQVARLQSRIR